MGCINIREHRRCMLPLQNTILLGLGTASTRTNKQKLMAKKYTERIINASTENIIIVDGALNTKDNSNPMKQQKMEKT